MIGGGAAIGGAMGRAVGSVESQAPGIARKVGGWLRKAKKGVASLAEGGAGVGGSPAAAQNVSSSDRAAVTSAAAADAAVAAATQAAASSSSRPQDASPTALQQTTT